jgi:adenine deaminase
MSIRFSTALCAVLVASSLGLVAQRPEAPPATLAIKAGRLLDVASRQIRTNAVLVIEGGRIKSIDAVVPPNTEVIDLSQQTVMPGLRSEEHTSSSHTRLSRMPSSA